MMLQLLRPMRIDPFFDYHTYAPSQEEILQTLVNGLSHHHIPKSQPVHNVNLDLMVSPDEIQRGGVISLEIPICQACSRCQGTGRAGFVECDTCVGLGLFWHSGQADVPIREDSRDGTTIPVSLRHLGVTNMYLTVRIDVSEASNNQPHPVMPAM